MFFTCKKVPQRLVVSYFIKTTLIVGSLFVATCMQTPARALAATISMEPAAGTYVVGSTFQVPIVVSSEGESINAIEVNVKFPQDKLQLISPTTGKSVIALWTEQPSFNNQTGSVTLQGVIPNGIAIERGLVTTMTFRVKSPGDVYIKFLDTTKVLKNDGLGTDVLNKMNGGLYHLVLPPPAGPIVTSETHPDPSVVYRDRSALLSWKPAESSMDENYSYMLSDDALDIPDDIAEGNNKTISYNNIGDGHHYFHIKAYHGGGWGGTTHFPINIDATPPAEFSISLLPSASVLRGREAVAQFLTTDELSGVAYYEINIVSLSDAGVPGNRDDQSVFTEATSPYVLKGKANTGRYDIIVRAFDHAGNFREEKTQLHVIAPLFSIVGDSGLEIADNLYAPWWLVVFSLFVLCILLLIVLYKLKKHHKNIDQHLESSTLPPTLLAKEADLAEKKKFYVNITQLVIASFVCLSAIAFPLTLRAYGGEALPPPMVTSISHDISNNEIFYIGGMTSVPESDINIFLQNEVTGETYNLKVVASKNGEWFYRHDRFLGAGTYKLWAQTSVSGVTSPPSPEERMSVERGSIQIGATRLANTFLFETLALLLLLVIAYLLYSILSHKKAIDKKHARWVSEVKEAEASIRTGFLLLKKDIEDELAIVQKAKLSGKLHAEEIGKEERLKKDLSWIEEKIEKEMFNLEHELTETLRASSPLLPE